MSAESDFENALRADLLVTRATAIGLTDLRDRGWTGRYQALDASQVVSLGEIRILQGIPSDVRYVAAPFEGRPDLLAYDLYGSSTLAWILRVANDLRLATDFVTGTRINVPRRRDVESLFLVNGR